MTAEANLVELRRVLAEQFPASNHQLAPVETLGVRWRPASRRMRSTCCSTEEPMAKLVLTPDLLHSPTRLATRMIARSRLLAVLEEAAHLEVGAAGSGAHHAAAESGEAEQVKAVHDFRVALRRLRSWLRAYRPFLDDTVTRRTERRLGRLSQLAGEVRDLQVEDAALRAIGSNPRASGGGGARWLADHLRVGVPRARRNLIAALAGQLPGAAATLSRQLQRYVIAVDLDAMDDQDDTMAATTASLMQRHADALQGKLRDWRRRPNSTAAAHATRIAAKRLRYLLEAFGESSRLAATAARHLGNLQDALGRAHDAQVVVTSLAEATAGAGKSLPPRRTVAALRRTLRAQTRSALREAHRKAGPRGLGMALTATTRLQQRLRHDHRAPRDGVTLGAPTRGTGG